MLKHRSTLSATLVHGRTAQKLPHARSELPHMPIYVLHGIKKRRKTKKSSTLVNLPWWGQPVLYPPVPARAGILSAARAGRNQREKRKEKTKNSSTLVNFLWWEQPVLYPPVSARAGILSAARAGRNQRLKKNRLKFNAGEPPQESDSPC